MTRQQHWDRIYFGNTERLSWCEAVPTVSLRLMEAAGLTADTCVLDVGGGDSRLVDVLVARGLRCLAVLDVSVRTGVIAAGRGRFARAVAAI
jgi:hypothetical protein